MGHWRQPMLLFILPKKPQEMNDFSSFLAVFFYGLMSQSLFLFFEMFFINIIDCLVRVDHDIKALRFLTDFC